MQTITLKDAHFNIIGYVQIDDNGNKTLKDNHYNIRGYYDARNNTTKDNHFNIVGHGDILTSLL